MTPLQARTFAIWTLTSAAIRLVAAYHLSEPAWYGLAFASYVFAGGHFLSEAFVFRSAGWGPGLLSPIIVASRSARCSSACQMLMEACACVQAPR